MVQKISRRGLFRAAKVGAVLVAGGVLAEADSERTNVDSVFLQELHKRKELFDKETPLEQQLGKSLLSENPLIALLILQNMTNDLILHPVKKPVEIESWVPKDKNKKISFTVISVASDENTSLKAAAFYQPDSKTMIFVFPGMDFPQDLGTINTTITDKSLPTRLEVEKFVKDIKRQILDKELPVEECRVFGNSLGAGSAVYALDAILKDQYTPQSSLFGRSPPETLLMEPWKAMEAARDTGSDVPNLARHIAEIRCYPGTPVDDESYNPVIGTKAGILIPQSPNTDFFGRIELHWLAGNGPIKLVESSPEELRQIGTTYLAAGAEEAIRAENNPEIEMITAAGPMAAGLSALGWICHRRNTVQKPTRGR